MTFDIQGDYHEDHLDSIDQPINYCFLQAHLYSNKKKIGIITLSAFS